MNSDSRTRWWTMWLLLLTVTAHVVEGNADWSATCSSGCTCKWADGKKVAECPNAGLTTIPDNLSPEIQVLDLRGNRLGALVSRAFSSVGLVNLQRIFLRNCSLQSVDKNAFDELTIMIEVDLSHNKLNRIHPDTFANNGKLRTLSLSHNPLEKLEAHQFPPLPLLRQLELVNCNLEVIDRKAFMHLGLLQTLRLSENRFTSLKSDIFQPLNKLKSLDLQVLHRLDCPLLLRNSLILFLLFTGQSLGVRLSPGGPTRLPNRGKPQLDADTVRGTGAPQRAAVESLAR